MIDSRTQPKQDGRSVTPETPKLQKHPVTGHNFVFRCANCKKLVPDNTMICPHCNKPAV